MQPPMRRPIARPGRYECGRFEWRHTELRKWRPRGLFFLAILFVLRIIVDDTGKSASAGVVSGECKRTEA